MSESIEKEKAKSPGIVFKSFLLAGLVTFFLIMLSSYPIRVEVTHKFSSDDYNRGASWRPHYIDITHHNR